MPDATTTLCAPCGQPISFIDCPTGGWWAHAEHPADGHDAFPPNGGHAADCAYVGGISQRCTCGPDASSNAFDDEKYPAAITVFCDSCDLTVTNDFVVSDRVTKAERLEFARAHLRGEGWSCAEAGDFCPACVPAAPTA